MKKTTKQIQKKEKDFDTSTDVRFITKDGITYRMTVQIDNSNIKKTYTYMIKKLKFILNLEPEDITIIEFHGINEIINNKIISEHKKNKNKNEF